jgi:hypothetical protein
LRTVTGNIRVMMSDTQKQVQIYKEQMAELQRKLETQMRKLVERSSEEDQP